MLEQAFQDVYTKFKLHFYQNVFQRFATREATLTTVESFCMEGIMAMGEPTIAEFSRMMQISTPYSYLHTVVERARERFSPEDCAKLEEMLTIVSEELMPELDLPKKNAE